MISQLITAVLAVYHIHYRSGIFCLYCCLNSLCLVWVLHQVPGNSTSLLYRFNLVWLCVCTQTFNINLRLNTDLKFGEYFISWLTYSDNSGAGMQIMQIIISPIKKWSVIVQFCIMTA